MTIRIGIPCALLYYQYYPMWQTFFEELRAEVIVSPPATQTMLAEGSARVVAETCLPVKVFLGHVISLVKKCDLWEGKPSQQESLAEEEKT